MKKRSLSFVALVMLIVCILSFTACGPATPPEPVVTKLTMIMEATNVQYVSGDTFDPTGITLKAEYDDGTTKNITEGFEFSKDPLKLDATEVEVTFGGMSVKQPITVVDAADAKILEFGGGDSIRCYGNGLVVAGGNQIESYCFPVNGGDDSLASNCDVGIAQAAANVGRWSWDGKKLTIIINNHTEDVTCDVVYDEEAKTYKFNTPYVFMDYVGQGYDFGGSCDAAAAAKYLTPTRIWPVAE